MPAQIIRGEDFVGIVCTRRKPKPCKYCSKPAPFECDFPMKAIGVVYPDGKERLCDAPICEEHAEHVGANLDYCKVHHQTTIVPAQRPIFGSKPKR